MSPDKAAEITFPFLPGGEQKAAAAAGRAETHFGALGCCRDAFHYRGAPDQSAGGSKIEQQQRSSLAACFILITSFLSGSKFACVDLSPRRLSAPYTNFSSAQLFLIFNFPFIRAAGALSV